MAALIACAGGAVAQDAPFGVWRFVATENLEAQRPGAGLVYRFRFGAAQADIFFYGGPHEWENGFQDPHFARMLQRMAAELADAEKARVFQRLALGEMSDRTVARLSFKFLPMSFERMGVPQTSLTYITATRRRLLKYRITAPTVVADGLEKDAEDLIVRSMLKQDLFDAPWRPE